jgi:4-hydroxybenzoyl-CoA reductase subunit beta
MLRLPPFEYLAPRTLAEAVDMVGQHFPHAMLVAGGTDVYPGMKRRLFEPKVLVGLRHIKELKTFAANGSIQNPKPVLSAVEGSEIQNGITLGAGLTLTEISSHPLIRARYPALARATGLVSTPQLRNMGTIGGNLCLDTRCTYYNQNEPWREALGYCLKKDGDTCWVAPGSARCWAVSSSDTAPVMIALGAQVRLLGPQGERTIPVQGLYHNDGIDYLKKMPGEILVDISLPEAGGVSMSYQKLRRRGAFDFPIVGVAAALRLAEDGTCLEASLVLGAVASYPIKAVDAEQFLVGQKLNEAVIQEAAKLAFKPAKPLDNTDMGHPYRKQMTRVYVVRALREAARPQVMG